MKILLVLISSLLPSIALAQDVAESGKAGEPGIESLLIQLGIIFAIFYLLLIRPQQKKYKTHTQMISTLKKGDKVVTAGGIIAKVSNAKEGDKNIQVEIADGVKVDVLRSTITEVVNENPQPKPEAKK